MTLRIYLGFFSLACLCFAAHGAEVKESLWSQFFARESEITFGVEIAGPLPYERNIERKFRPASTSKLFTAGIALERLGADFRYETILNWDQVDASTAANVTLIGDGDPTWALSELGETLRTRVEAIARGLVAKGIKTVRGEIHAQAADPRWDQIRYADGWAPEDLVSCDGASAEGLNLDINCATYVITSPTSGSWAHSEIVTPVQLQIEPGETTQLKVTPLSIAAPAKGYLITGILKSGSESFSLPVHNVEKWIAGLLREEMINAGISFVAASRSKPASATPVSHEKLVFTSVSLKEILKPFLKNSINFIGDALLKTIAVKSGMPGDDLLTLGTQIINEQVNRNGKETPVELYDGSGLSQKSQVTPRAMLAYLIHLSKLKEFSAVWAALPIAGVDGTLGSRMKGTPAQGILRAKTGTLRGVYNLAGYVPSGKAFVPFVILTETNGAFQYEARKTEDRVGAKLTQLIEAKGTSGRSLLVKTAFEADDGEDPIGGRTIPYPYVPEHAGHDAQ